MTDFMQRIDDLLHYDAAAIRSPIFVPVTPKSTGQGAHEQVEARSYAEQLLSEANAVLGPTVGSELVLNDLCGTLDQVFTLTYETSWAQIATRFYEGQARSELLGSSVEVTDSQLLDNEGLADLIVVMIADARSKNPEKESVK